MRTDVLFAHNDDLGAPIGVLYGVSVYKDADHATRRREDDLLDKRVNLSQELGWSAPTKAQRTGSVLSIAGVVLQDGLSFQCKDGTVATLALPAEDRRSKQHQRWHLHKDNGVSFWGFAAEAMMHLVVAERKTEEIVIQ